MRIGFCGAHRTGKTTLAKAIAEIYGYDFINSSASGVYARFGFVPNQSLSIQERYSVQCSLLGDYLERISGRDNFVTDRTPFDYIGYMLSELNTEAFLGDNCMTDAKLDKYLAACQSAASKTLDLAFFVEPAIPVVAADGKGNLSKHFINNVSTHIQNAVFNRPVSSDGLRLVVPIMKDIGTRIEQRVTYCRGVIDEFPDILKYIEYQLKNDSLRATYPGLGMLH